MVNVIFDMDPGHDDAIALMTALAHPEKIRVLGITTVAGNQTVEKVTDNILRLLDYLEHPLPVAAGCDRPIRRPLEVQPQAHGESGMDGPELPATKSHPISVHAVEFLHKTISQSEEKVTIVALAPMTNLALFVRMYPQLLSKIEKIAFMGGSLYSGNIIEKAEFNIYHDPEAAKIVFESGVPMVMSGLEICARAATPLASLDKLMGRGRASQVVYELMQFFGKYSRDRGWEDTTIFDLVPVMHILHPELFESKFFHLDVETEGTLCRGMTVADFRHGRDRAKDTMEVLLQVDNAKYQQYFFESIARLDQMI